MSDKFNFDASNPEDRSKRLSDLMGAEMPIVDENYSIEDRLLDVRDWCLNVLKGLNIESEYGYLLASNGGVQKAALKVLACQKAARAALKKNEINSVMGIVLSLGECVGQFKDAVIKSGKLKRKENLLELAKAVPKLDDSEKYLASLNAQNDPWEAGNFVLACFLEEETRWGILKSIYLKRKKAGEPCSTIWDLLACLPKSSGRTGKGIDDLILNQYSTNSKSIETAFKKQKIDWDKLATH